MKGVDAIAVRLQLFAHIAGQKFELLLRGLHQPQRAHEFVGGQRGLAQDF